MDLSAFAKSRTGCGDNALAFKQDYKFVKSKINQTLVSGNVNRLASVKCTVFDPSGRKVWTVIGNDYEYWTEPEIPFCSCPDFYFSTMFGGQECYHLARVREAVMDPSRCETLHFSDSQYAEFISAIIQDAELFLRN